MAARCDARLSSVSRTYHASDLAQSAASGRGRPSSSGAALSSHRSSDAAVASPSSGASGSILTCSVARNAHKRPDGSVTSPHRRSMCIARVSSAHHAATSWSLTSDFCPPTRGSGERASRSMRHAPSPGAPPTCTARAEASQRRQRGTSTSCLRTASGTASMRTGAAEARTGRHVRPAGACAGRACAAVAPPTTRHHAGGCHPWECNRRHRRRPRPPPEGASLECFRARAEGQG